MLILSRRERESILIGDDIEITVCRIAGNRVKVGLRAPEGVRIRRAELPDVPEAARDSQHQLIGR
jgi:carbon storage regulator